MWKYSVLLYTATVVPEFIFLVVEYLVMNIYIRVLEGMQYVDMMLFPAIFISIPTISFN
jgi:hypothetical protein